MLTLIIKNNILDECGLKKNIMNHYDILQGVPLILQLLKLLYLRQYLDF